MIQLSQKTAYARSLLETIISNGTPPSSVVVAWTGGKDSTVVLDLWRNVLRDAGISAPPRVLSLDTGCKFPEVTTFRDKLAVSWQLDMHIVTPPADNTGYPVAANVVDCCRRLKVLPLQHAVESLNVSILLTGIRRDEHPARASSGHAEKVISPPHQRLHPIFDFNEMDVWAYTFERQLPYCPLYDEGYRSLGCKPCTSPPTNTSGHERQGRNAVKEQNMQTLRSLGYF